MLKASNAKPEAWVSEEIKPSPVGGDTKSPAFLSKLRIASVNFMALQSLFMTSPEGILDSCITQLRNEPNCSGYIGRLNIEQVESPSFRSFLYLFQQTMNEALRLEGVNASGGVPHPPFHFDYLQVSDGSKNAHAFQHGGFAFIVVTLPLVESLCRLSQCLSRSPLVLQLLGVDPGMVEPDVIQGLLLQVQMNFLISHEYTHHIHLHCDENQDSSVSVWTEFLDNAACGNIHAQAQELDADGYAAYLVLAFLLRGERRETALSQLSCVDMPDLDGDELLLRCFFFGVLAFFCDIWHDNIDMASVYRFRHPPPPVRIKYVIDVAAMWCGQNESVPQSWFSPVRLQELFHAAVEAIGGTSRQTWDAQMAFLSSPDGVQYDRQLFERFEIVRKERHGLAQETP